MLEDSAGFLRQATETLKSDVESAGAQFLVSLLVSNNMLLPFLCNPEFPEAAAIAVARIAMRTYPTADVALARLLAGLVHRQDHDTAQAGRLIRILERISDGARTYSSLARLLRHPDPSLRSKVVLMIGRGSKSVRWVRPRLTDPDSRIRANAVESIWGIDSPEAYDLLASMLHDPNNRVVGNAILGLYLLGDSGMVTLLHGLAAHPAAAFRATAAWAMGESADPRFVELLASMLRDESGLVRKRAFAAIGRLKASAATLAKAPARVLSGRFVDSTDPGWRRIRVAVVSREKSDPGRVLPTQFVLSEGEKPVTAYRVSERRVPDLLAVVLLMPRLPEEAPLWQKAAIDCLPWKRPRDFWARILYQPGPNQAAGAAPGAEDNLKFLSGGDALAAEFGRRGWQPACTDLWHAIWRSIQDDYGAVKGRRHLIVFNGSESSGAPGHSLVQAVKSARATFQVVSTVDNPVLREFCGAVGGTFWSGAPPQAGDLLRSAYLDLTAPYEIAYRPAGQEAERLRVRLCSAEGRGETYFAIPHGGVGIVTAPNADTSPGSDCPGVPRPTESSSPSNPEHPGPVESC